MQADGPSTEVLNFEPLAPKFEAFGWFVQRVDGNDLDAAGRGLRRGPRTTPEPQAPHHHLRHPMAQGRAVPRSARAQPLPPRRAGRMERGPGDPRRGEGAVRRSKYETPGPARDGGGAQDLGDDRLDRRRRASAPSPRPFGHALVELAETRPDDRRHDGRPRQVHRPAHLRAGLSRPLLPDGHGRAAADGRGRRPGARGLHALRHHLRGVRLAPRLRLHLPWRSPRRTSTSRSSARCPA